MKLVHYLLFFLGIVILSCSSEDEDPIAIKIEINELTLSIDENPSNGQILGKPDVTTNSEGLVFSIENEIPTGAVIINESTGEIAVLDKTKFDFELNKSISFVAIVSKNEVVKRGNVLINVNDVDDAILSTEDASFEIEENSVENGSIIGTVPASSDQGNVTFSLFSQSVEGALSVDETTGEIKVEDFAKFDYETNSEISAEVTVSFGGTSKSSSIVITIIDVADAVISAADLTVSILENPRNNEQIGVIQASSDQGDVTFAIISQSVDNAIIVNENTGTLSVNDSTVFDYESQLANHLYQATIRVSKGSITKDISVQIEIEDVVNPVIDEILYNDQVTQVVVSSKEFIISGQNFGDNIDDISITFSDGDISMDLDVLELVSSNQIVVSKPFSGIKTGRIQVSIRGEQSSYDLVYQFADPLILNIDNTNNNGYVGDQITITGQYFTQGLNLDTEGSYVKMYSEDEIPGVDAGTSISIITFNSSELTFLVPKTSVNSTLLIYNGVEKIEVDFNVKWNVSFQSAMGSFVSRGYAVRGQEVQIEVSNVSPKIEDITVRLNSFESGHQFFPEVTNSAIKQITADGEVRNYLSFIMPDEVGIYMIEVSVGDNTANGGYTIMVTTDNSMSYINGFYYDDAADELAVIGSTPRLGIFGATQTFYIQLFQYNEFQLLELAYEGLVNSMSGGGIEIFTVYNSGFAASGLSGSFHVRIKKVVNGVASYTPITTETLTIVF